MQTIGLGSDNKLTMDIVDQLKAVDKEIMIDPIDKDIEEVGAKREALVEINTLLESFQTVTDNLVKDDLYLGRNAYVSGDGIGVSIDKGVMAQSLSVEVTQLATESVVQSNVFEGRDVPLSNEDGTFDISINGKTTSFDVPAGSTLEELMQMINDKSDLSAGAKILNTGNNEYRLIISGKESGTDNRVVITESENLNTGLSLEENMVQESKGSKFIFNGVEITRDSNDVSDLVFGVNMNFTQISDEGKATVITIEEDIGSILTEVEAFTTSYNELVTKLSELTAYDEGTKEAGVFQGNSDIRTIQREINRIILSIDSENRSLPSFGVTLNKGGNLDFDAKILMEKYEESSESVQNFFQGENIENRGVVTHKDGIFYKMDESLDRYVGETSMLTNLKTSFESQEKRLNEEKEKAVATLDSRYERMAREFAQQDAIIASIEQQFKAVEMQIDAQNNQ